MESTKMRFILSGFSQAMGIRIFAFQGIAADQTRTMFTVEADLALTRRYDIRLQELPLLCREVLDRRGEGEENHTFIYTEDDMRVYANDRTRAREAIAHTRKSLRKFSPARSEMSGSFRNGNEAGSA